MSNVPLDFLYGIDVAIKKLRPYAKFEIYNTTITKWEDITGSEPPTWEEIKAQIEADEKAFLDWQKSQQPTDESQG